MPSKCGNLMGLAKNGTDRGLCTRRAGHRGRHGNQTCIRCSAPAPRHQAYCLGCNQHDAAVRRQAKATEIQNLKPTRDLAVALLVKLIDGIRNHCADDILKGIILGEKASPAPVLAKKSETLFWHDLSEKVDHANAN